MFTSYNGVWVLYSLIIEPSVNLRTQRRWRVIWTSISLARQFKCAYEASKFGYWIYRELVTFGYECLVVNAADIPTSNKESSEKADPSDSRKIGKALRAGLRTGIHIP